MIRNFSLYIVIAICVLYTINPANIGNPAYTLIECIASANSLGPNIHTDIIPLTLYPNSLNNPPYNAGPNAFNFPNFSVFVYKVAPPKIVLVVTIDGNNTFVEVAIAIIGVLNVLI